MTRIKPDVDLILLGDRAVSLRLDGREVAVLPALPSAAGADAVKELSASRRVQLGEEMDILERLWLSNLEVALRRLVEAVLAAPRGWR